jgi:hypothetical protein
VTPAWHERKALWTLLGEDAERATALGYSAGPDPLRPQYAFLAAAIGARRRSFVRLKPPAAPAVLVTFDLAPPSPAALTVRPESAVEFVRSVDLDGVRIGDWVVLFHNEIYSAREPQFFFVDREGPLKCLVTGLAPGAWELWHNGFVKEPSLEVNPRAGALYFEGLAGNYFFRRYS